MSIHINPVLNMVEVIKRSEFHPEVVLQIRMGCLNVHITYQDLVGIYGGSPGKAFQVKSAPGLFQGQLLHVGFKNMMGHVEVIDLGAEVFDINIIKIHLTHQGIHILVFIPEMQIIEDDLFKIDGPWLAWLFDFSGIRLRTEIVEYEFKVAMPVLLFLQVYRSIIQLNMTQIQVLFFDAAE